MIKLSFNAIKSFSKIDLCLLYLLSLYVNNSINIKLSFKAWTVKILTEFSRQKYFYLKRTCCTHCTCLLGFSAASLCTWKRCVKADYETRRKRPLISIQQLLAPLILLCSVDTVDKSVLTVYLAGGNANTKHRHTRTHTLCISSWELSGDLRW